MALTFNTTIATPEGIEIADAYGRVAVYDDVTGDRLNSALRVYISEQAFLEGKQPFSRLSFTTDSTFAYDRSADGSDILDLAHDNFISILAGEGVSVAKVL